MFFAGKPAPTTSAGKPAPTMPARVERRHACCFSDYDWRMTTITRSVPAVLALITAVALAAVSARGAVPPPSPVEESDEALAGFGTVHFYRTEGRPVGLAIVLSREQGWTAALADTARTVASHGYLVAGVDVKGILATLDSRGDFCSYPAADLENLAHHVEARFGFTAYRAPVLIGYGIGGTLAYAVIVQAPATANAGAISVDFCPDLPLARQLCRGAGLSFEQQSASGDHPARLVLAAASQVRRPWIVLESAHPGACDASDVAQYVDDVDGARIVELTALAAKNRASPADTEMSALLDGLTGITSAQLANAYQGALPLREMPATGKHAGTLVVFFSGDGGWADIDRSVTERMAAAGADVVGWDSLAYFWNARTPETTARDVEDVVSRYLAKWHDERVALAGYSFGANILPATFNALDVRVRASVQLVALLGPEQATEFEFHFSDWLREKRNDAAPLAPEIARIDAKVLCISGSDEGDEACKSFSGPHFAQQVLPGGHHFGGRYDVIANTILGALPR